MKAGHLSNCVRRERFYKEKFWPSSEDQISSSKVFQNHFLWFRTIPSDFHHDILQYLCSGGSHNSFWALTEVKFMISIGNPLRSLYTAVTITLQEWRGFSQIGDFREWLTQKRYRISASALTGLQRTYEWLYFLWFWFVSLNSAW